MNIAILGGAGYIGGVTTHYAQQQGHTVTVVDDLSTGRDYNVPKGVELVRMDIRDRAAVAHLFKTRQFDTVMHFAARILVPESMQKPFEYFDVNVVGALNAIDQAAANGVKRYIFSSTAAVYGEPLHIPLTEEDPNKPVNPYGFSKFLNEQLLKSYEITHGLQWTALRYFNVAGAFGGVGTDYTFAPSHIIPCLLDRMHKQEPITIYGDDYDTPDGTAIRDYVHVLDLARAHVLAAEVMNNGTPLNQPINLGSRHGFSVKQVADTFNKVTGAGMPIVYGARRPGDPVKLIASNARAKKLLGWEPEFGLERIIQDHYDWYAAKERKPVAA